MSFDHSIAYKKKGRLNSSQKRLNKIMVILAEEVDFKGKSFADIGCSNGYITSLIADKFKPKKAEGFDVDRGNLEIAQKLYPEIEFKQINLNQKNNLEKQYDIVTCFETLEHVGKLDSALDNLLTFKKNNGFLLIAVPIEICLSGIVRLLWRMAKYGYKDGNCFNEFTDQKNLFLKYLISLITGKRTSKFRSQKSHWGTHLGFDYRDIDEYLQKKSIYFRAKNQNMTRFYLIK